MRVRRGENEHICDRHGCDDHEYSNADAFARGRVFGEGGGDDRGRNDDNRNHHVKEGECNLSFCRGARTVTPQEAVNALPIRIGERKRETVVPTNRSNKRYDYPVEWCEPRFSDGDPRGDRSSHYADNNRAYRSIP